MCVNRKEDIVHAGTCAETLQDKQRSGDSIKDEPEVSEEVVPVADKHLAEERRLVRKLDMRVIPLIILIFIVNYIDVRTFIFW